MKAILLSLTLLAIPAVLLAGVDDLAKLGKPTLKRASTFDKTGGNNDRLTLAPGEVGKLEIAGTGNVKHVWFTLKSDDPDYLRKTRLKMYWDGAAEPAVDSPFGDFFCLGHGEVNDVVSSMICVSKAPHIATPPGAAAFNCYFPMPFANGAVVEVANGGKSELICYAQVDYEAYDSPAWVNGMGRFHARYLTEKTTPVTNPPYLEKDGNKEPINPGGEENYVILDTRGEGHYVGCCLSVDSRKEEPGKWYEGDDMIFVDGEPWPPAIHGTGTEDYFNNAWGVRREFNTPYYGCSYLKKRDTDDYFNGLFSVYRFHVVDPISFKKSIKVTIEHGHANDAGNQYSSVAYWYQNDSNVPVPKAEPPAGEKKSRADLNKHWDH